MNIKKERDFTALPAVLLFFVLLKFGRMSEFEPLDDRFVMPVLNSPQPKVVRAMEAIY